ncbi:MAG: hypothetical protein GF400_10905 [Candidatus Eisenbacteria bacterium]|nr:hypothetical protein [Candidatus Eisenbacteria bacterium]
MPSPDRKSVVVTGDLIWDYNLARHPVAPHFHHDPPKSAVLDESPGGAWFLLRILQKVCGTADVRGVARPGRSGPGRKTRVARAYQIWTHFPSADPDEPGTTWRVSRLLGCQMAASKGTEPRVPARDLRNPDTLVLDDQCLGFRDNPDQWPLGLRDGEPRRIVLKTFSSDPGNPLWERLFDDEHASRLTVVLSADILRDRGAALSRGLSWDQTIEELDNEFRRGGSSRDLARCRRVVVLFGASGVACFSRLAQPFGTASRRRTGGADCVFDRVRFERLVYDSFNHEGTWSPEWPGQTLGGLSLLTAAIVRHECEPREFPLFLACGRALAAVRANHVVGGGAGGQLDSDAGARAGMEILALQPVEEDGGDERDPAHDFFSAYPQYDDSFPFGYPVKPRHIASRGRRSDILRDVVGDGREYMVAKATEVVLEGPEKALEPAPEARYGHFLTVDRDETARVNSIQNLLLRYRENLEDPRPMSIAVFGRPGSGKSFAVKQLLSTIFEDEKPLEFNLSQFGPTEDLHNAFHQVRDRTVRGGVPVVFWDEFDAQGLRWLKEFLAPMQDSEFRAGSLTHPFGRSVFVFAGGTKHTFDEFARKAVEAAAGEESGRGETAEAAAGEESGYGEAGEARVGHGEADDNSRREWMHFCEMKGPDFVSRLRGYVDIKGPNPMAVAACARDGGEAAPEADEDLSHYIRRALILRGSLERNCSSVIDQSGRALVNAGVVNAFLRVRRYWHGARSIDSIVSMSRPGRDGRFGPASLPPPHLLRLHVTDDFVQHIEQGQLEASLVELLAQACHEAWMGKMRDQGYVLGSPRDDESDPPRHPRLMEYRDLPEGWKEDNRKSARVVRAKLAECGLAIREKARLSSAEKKAVVSESSVEGPLLASEHGIWLRDRLINGYSRAGETRDAIRTHTDIAAFSEIPEEHKDYNRAIVESVFMTLDKNDYAVIKERT